MKTPNLSLAAAVALAHALRADFAGRIRLRAEIRQGAPGWNGARIFFIGGTQGEHSLALSASTEARVHAHWEGYVYENRKAVACFDVYDVERRGESVAIVAGGDVVALRAAHTGSWTIAPGLALLPEVAFDYEGDPRVVELVEKIRSERAEEMHVASLEAEEDVPGLENLPRGPLTVDQVEKALEDLREEAADMIAEAGNETDRKMLDERAEAFDTALNLVRRIARPVCS